MRHYFYHGFEPFGLDKESVEYMLEIINSGGIKNRKDVRNYTDESLKHICLYRKNENYDYTDENWIFNSARGGWIDNCMVFVISDDIDAKYLPPHTNIEGMGPSTNLVDEWRYFDDIPMDKIVGIAIPLNSFKEILDGKITYFKPEEVEEIRSALKELKQVCKKLGLKVFNSEKKNFTDLLDSKLQLGENMKDAQDVDIMI